MKSICCIAVFLASSCISCYSQPEIIAHRGFWNKSGSAQNSLSSLGNAIDMGFYGSEVDAYITKDGVVVLSHDNKYQEIEIEMANYEELLPLRLPNGEPIPTLQQYIDRIKQQQQTKLILEIKPHSTIENENRAVTAIVQLVDENGIAELVDYISFSENICQELIKSNPKHRVSYLSGNKSPEELKKEGYWGLDYSVGALKQHPDWIKEAKEQGLTVNVWTVNSEDDMHYFIYQGVNYITTDNPLLLKEITE
jgi:glycerophosphoryl diester phosphodiesterase